MTNDVGHFFFPNAYWPFVYLLWRHVCLFLINLSYCWVVRSSSYSRYKSLIRYTTCKDFLLFCWLSSHFHDSVLPRTEVFILMKFSLFFPFIVCAFGVISRQLLTDPRSHRPALMLSSKSFRNLAVCFELIFLCTVMYRSKFILLHVDSDAKLQSVFFLTHQQETQRRAFLWFPGTSLYPHPLPICWLTDFEFYSKTNCIEQGQGPSSAW